MAEILMSCDQENKVRSLRESLDAFFEVLAKQARELDVMWAQALDELEASDKSQ